MDADQPALLALPDEILTAVFFYLDPDTLSAVQLSSKRLCALAQEPLLWRYNCRIHYRFWHPKHEFLAKLRYPVANVPWKQIFVGRKRIDHAAKTGINAMVATQQHRASHIEHLAEQGYDVKDELLRHKNAADDAEDVLARRFWSSAALTSMHRSIAMEEWRKLKRGESTSLERVLGAYDMFVLDSGEGQGDLDSIGGRLDDLAAQFKAENLQYADLSTRELGILLVAFLRRRGFEGVSNERYGQIQQNFIGIALVDEGHEALPLITVAIFCCVAQRLGLDAKPCGYPYHIYAIIYAPENKTLDGEDSQIGASPGVMYLDPFRCTGEVPRSDLEAQLRSMGVSADIYSVYLDAAHPIEMIIRTARNIRRAVEATHAAGDPSQAHVGIRFAYTHLNLHSALHAAMWAWLYLERGAHSNNAGVVQAGDIATHRRRILITKVVQQCMQYFPWETWLIERHMAPLFQNLPEQPNLIDMIEQEYASDKSKKPPKRRTRFTKNVKYQIGQVFTHRRYGYYGAIYGWDPKCYADDDWMLSMNVDGLPGGREQSFYNVLCEDSSSRYVAEENIVITQEAPPDFLLNKLAGRYFKRWDAGNGRFVSNLKDEYPDD